MKPKTLFLAILFSLNFFTYAQAEVIERIIAVVNDEIVTEQDLQFAMGPVISQYRAVYSGPELEQKMQQARKDFLQRVVEDKLILGEAKKKQVIVKDAEVDEMMADVRNKFPTRELFLKAIENQGVTEKKLWSRFRDQLMTQKLVSYEVKSRINVSPGEVSEYYKNHPEEFSQNQSINLYQILIRDNSRTDEEAKALAQSLADKIKEGASFEEVAKSNSEGAESSEGGAMGWVEKGQLMPEIDEVIFSLAIGEVSTPMKSSLGYHIFKVTDKRESSVRPLSEVRAQVQDKIAKQKTKSKLDEWLKELKDNAYISIR